jgi:hypothetical protein
MNLLKEKRDLENYVEGKDASLVVKQKNRIADINNELTNLSDTKTTDEKIAELEAELETITDDNNPRIAEIDAEISELETTKTKEDAIQEQSTTEIPVQSETGVSETMEGGAPQTELEVTTEQGPQEQIDNRPIEERQTETEAKIKRKDLFIGVGEFSTELGGSDKAAVPVSHREINGIEFVEYAHPDTGSIDVIVTGKSNNDFVGFYRIYENGKPTDKWSSKFENKSRNKEDFKTMIGGVQNMLPKGHQYTEKTSISTDGLRVWIQQLSKGYELQYDDNGNLIGVNNANTQEFALGEQENISTADICAELFEGENIVIGKTDNGQSLLKSGPFASKK